MIMSRRLILCILLVLAPLALSAQKDGTRLQMDTATVQKTRLINDYTLIGVNYGVTFSNTYFSPAKSNRSFLYKPNYISVTYTKFSKLFDTIPYFALVLGAAYGHEGYAFEVDKDTGESADVDGARECSMEVFELPAMAQMHIDFYPGKIMANAGVYAGWRNSITRSGPGVTDQYANAFKSYEHRLDYGFQGGAGFALMFDPIEIHFNCLVRWSWSNLYDPDYNSSYYYRYAYPIDIMATVGIHFQLTKRWGKTRREIRREAYDTVYGKTQDTAGKSR